MTHYLLQTLAFLALFLLVYDLFLKKETFFNWNRTYLLATAILSFVLPFIRIDALKQSVGQDFIVQLPAVVLGQSSSSVEGMSTFSGGFSWTFLWIFGAAIALCWFAIKLIKIIRFKRQGVATQFKGFTLIKLFNSAAVFSFFRTIFLGEDLSEKQQQVVLEHEQVHVKQWHTIDLLLFEGLRILFWFNPLIYIYQKRLTTLHEYIADEKVARQQGKSVYYQELLSQVFQTQNVSFVNTFFKHSLIKKRIIMLQKSKSSSAKLLKFIMVLPLLAVMVLYASCSQETDNVVTETEASIDSEVMAKINELSEAIMKVRNISDLEIKAMEILATIAKEGDKTYPSVQEYLDEQALQGQKQWISDFVVGYNADIDVPFAAIDKVPTFPGCSGDNEALKACMVQKLTQFVGGEFNPKVADYLSLSGRHRIAIQFKIDVDGNIKDIAVRAPEEVLAQEARRTIEAIPTMIPGEHKGKKVGVLYSLPIIFEIK